ncbi:MAG: Asp-tRNA(Asn)/Glu-tRNA(Gln) amidotransferase subunit GatB [Candidatus Omnitrophota bacterium]|nr:MAG: Asp-tRNA(Asn)/Glu-tRNA(Gln) amidotransferase subunit GatB [Candidatus Omnitrophota bacterium]
MDEFDIVIGLEVHVQLKTKSKIFCSCSTEFESPPNTNICPVCCGYPGVLPVFNQKALELGVRVARGLGCEINPQIYFERKSYFYPDLPKNYQISQYKMPLGENGWLTLPSGKRIGIGRVHLEEDAGKLVHKKDYSLVDLNRTGIPLLEIVSKPDINSADEAFDYLTYLKLALQYIEASDCDMEKGILRCDANISLKKKGTQALGVKVELKNMNSFRGVRDALDYEAKRQAKTLEKSEKITQETRLWDETKRKTMVMRSKEEAHDYRYFPEPDLRKFSISLECKKIQENFLSKIEMPLKKREKFTKMYGLSAKDTDVLISDMWLANFFEEATTTFSDYKKMCGWLLGPFLEQVNALGASSGEVKISPANFAKVVKYFAEGKLNNLAAKKVLSLCVSTNKDIDRVIEEEGLVQVSGHQELQRFIEEALSQNPKPVQEYLGGKQQAIQFLVGQVMRKTQGKANPKVVRELLEESLKKHKGESSE